MKLDTNFFKKYRIDQNMFDSLNIQKELLMDIYNDYNNKRSSLDSILAITADNLRRISTVHSVKYRTKNSEHLIEKIIRKSISKGHFDYTVANYMSRITDLIGIRVLHLYKDEWLSIHNYIIREWDLIDQPIANIRDGDPKEILNLYKDMGCQINEHQNGYRSIHYLIQPKNALDKLVCEIQVRTIFEEGWSEIDHRIRYPYNTSSNILREYLEMFNRLAGSADEMGTFVKKLDENIKKTELMYKKELAREVRNRENKIKKQMNEIKKRDHEINKLKQTIYDLKVSESQKELLLNDIIKIEKSSTLIENYTNQLSIDKIEPPNFIENNTDNIANSLSYVTNEMEHEDAFLSAISINNLIELQINKTEEMNKKAQKSDD